MHNRNVFISSWLITALLLFGITGCSSGGGGSGDTSSPSQYTVGGNVTGLTSGTLALAINGAEQLTLTNDGTFTFGTIFEDGESYSITLVAQPDILTCTIDNGSGTITGSDITNITVTCNPSEHFTIGGSITGVSGSVTLQNNGSDDLILDADAAFTFATAIIDRSSYLVTVSSSPNHQCNVSNGDGVLAGTNVTDIVVNCIAAPQVSTVADTKQVVFRWSEVTNATFYRLQENPDGYSGYTQVGVDLTVTSTRLDVSVLNQDWSHANYIVQACNEYGCVDSAAVGIVEHRLATIGYFKATNTESDDQFGSALALSGDGNTLAVAAPYEDSVATGIDGNQADNNAIDSGAVYLFLRGANGWGPQAYIKASNTGAQDLFGSSIALSSDGNTLAVGAPGEGSNATGIDGNQGNDSASGSGAVYIFTRSGDVWNQQAYIKASNTGNGDHFGKALALSGDGNTLAVGAPDEDSGATDLDGNQSDNSALSSGAAYLFSRTDMTWTQAHYIKASNTESGDLFGTAVALIRGGDFLAVGAPYEDGVKGDETNNSATSSGAAYAFQQNAGWQQTYYVKSDASVAGERFGQTLALDGYAGLFIGAPGESSAASGIINAVDFAPSDCGEATPTNCKPSSGAVYGFGIGISGGEWGMNTVFKASNPEVDDNFGVTVSSSVYATGGPPRPTFLAVGAHREDSSSTTLDGIQGDNNATDSGAVYLFSSEYLGPKYQKWYVKATNTDTGDFFGTALALSDDGDTLAIGANMEDSASSGLGGEQVHDCGTTSPVNCAAQAGAAYLY